MRIRICILYMYTYTYLWVVIYVTYLHMYTCIWIYVYVCMYTFTYTYILIHKHSHAGVQVCKIRNNHPMNKEGRIINQRNKQQTNTLTHKISYQAIHKHSLNYEMIEIQQYKRDNPKQNTEIHRQKLMWKMKRHTPFYNIIISLCM